MGFLNDLASEMKASPVAPSAKVRDGLARSAMFTDLSVLFLRIVEIVIIIGIGLFLVHLRPEKITAALALDHYRLAALAAVLYSGLVAATGAYELDSLFHRARSVKLAMRSWIFTGIFLVTLGFVMKTSAGISREWALLWFMSVGLSLATARIACAAWLHANRKSGRFDVRTAVFGGGRQAEQVIRYLKNNDRLTLDLIGRYDDRSEDREPKTDRFFKGDLKRLIRHIRSGKVDQVIVALPWSSEERIQEVVSRLALTPVRIRLAPDLVAFAYLQKPFTLLGEMPVMTLFDRPISGLDQSVKWLEDQVLAWVSLILLAPLFLLVAIAIKIDSPGPIFFRQDREGFNDRAFRIWKFRSMRTEASQFDSIEQARRGDARVTRVGAFLRKTSIDELPQLFNVVLGDMSLVGPRPHAPSTKAGHRLFKEVVDTYAARHRVKPGITGWAQVKGWRGPTETEEKLLRRLDHDLYYIDNWSLWFDLYIMARTVTGAVFQRNAF